MTDHIAVYDEALDAALCHEIIEKFRASDKRRGSTGSGVDLKKKDSYDINVSVDPGWAELHRKILMSTSRYVVKYMREYAFTLTGNIATQLKDPNTGELFEMTHENIDKIPDMALINIINTKYRFGHISAQHYIKNSGGYHYWHSEIYPLDPQCEVLHRVLFFMFYLNTVETGGETEFYYQKKAIQPKQGRMVIAPASFTHTHKGNVPVSDDKYILTSWIMFKRAEEIYAPRPA